MTKAFADAGIMVHAYLMYGFPTQTARETVEALENVRRLFAAGCLHSGVLAPLRADGAQPDRAGSGRVRHPAATGAARAGFAVNEMPYEDPEGCDHEKFGPGLRKALYNFMHGVGLDADVRSWFDFRVRKPSVSG